MFYVVDGECIIIREFGPHIAAVFSVLCVCVRGMFSQLKSTDRKSVV